MYATCLHCHTQLGTNDAIERFPVGRRLAFDASKGRLWVVCSACARWNLTPLEERWEAVEDCERLFRVQKLRAQTDHIGLARLPEGTELIRIGSPLRPEFAAWRYGRVFSARLHRRVAVIGVAGAIVGAGVFAASGFVSAAQLALLSPLAIHILRAGTLTALAVRRQFAPLSVIGNDAKPLRVVRAHLDHTRLLSEPGEPLRLQLKHSYGRQELVGDRAARATSALLAGVNAAGAGAGTVRSAASFIADSGDPERAISRVCADATKRRGDFDQRYASYARGDWMRVDWEGGAEPFPWRSRRNVEPKNRGALYRLPTVERLALEMALHEHSEQFALDHELGSLERDWREAEEIAAIADDLLLPPNVRESLDKSRKRGT